VSPKFNRNPFTLEEDELILSLHAKGHTWLEIAGYLSGRSMDQTRVRFNNTLDPNRITTAWTMEEDRILFDAQQVMGNKWTEIAKHLPGRTMSSIKNRWYSERRKLNVREAHLEGQV
jgi:hypothetical protein